MENYILIHEKSFEKARREIRNLQKANNQKIVFSSNDDELNRKVMEKEPIDLLLLSQSERRDFLKQRNSGLNHVLAKIAKKNNIEIGINLDEIIESGPLQKSMILARVRQNIKLCSKNKVKMRFIALKKENQRDSHDLKSLGIVLGMPTWMTKSLSL